MSLEADELKRRIDAARTLRGMTQVQLAERVNADGLGKHDVGRLERGDIPLTRALRDSLCRNLGVPSAWFTAEDVDVVFAAAPQESTMEMFADIVERLSRIEATAIGNADVLSALTLLEEAADPGGSGGAAEADTPTAADDPAPAARAPRGHAR